MNRLQATSARFSDVERFFIDTLYDRDVTGNLERELRTLETWAESYPRDAVPHGLIGGLAASSTGKSELAIAEADKAIALDPDTPYSYSNKAFHQLLLNRPDDALLTVGRARERNLNNETLLLVPYFVAFLKGTDDELRRTAEAVRKAAPPKTSSRIWRRSPWLAPAACKMRDGWSRCRSRSRSGRVDVNGPACSKRAERCGKRFTGMRLQPGRAPSRRSSSEGAAAR